MAQFTHRLIVLLLVFSSLYSADRKAWISEVKEIAIIEDCKALNHKDQHQLEMQLNARCQGNSFTKEDSDELKAEVIRFYESKNLLVESVSIPPQVSKHFALRAAPPILVLSSQHPSTMGHGPSQLLCFLRLRIRDGSQSIERFEKIRTSYWNGPWHDVCDGPIYEPTS